MIYLVALRRCLKRGQLAVALDIRIGRVLSVRDQVIPILGLLQSTERHLGTRNVFLGVLEVFELHNPSATARRSSVLRVLLRTKVSSFHSIALFLFASVYEKPST